MVLGARELDQNGINSSDQNWSNLHTVYTHGSGLIAAFANQRAADNQEESQSIEWAQGQDPGQDSLEQATGPFQQQIYFGQTGEGSPGYSIVGKAPGASDGEVDMTPTGVQSRTTYAGSGGVGVGGFFHKLMYGIKFGDANFLLSSRVGAHSKVLYYRDPVERVEKVAPWLTLDSDPYPVVVDGQIQWVVDGYTTTDQYPQSERDSFSDMTSDVVGRPPGVRTLPTDQINYMRNAVKATVDAYTGEVKLYAWDDTDPILKAWESAFPNTVLGRDQIPSELLAHLRYPEDMFKVQRFQYARYHVTDSNDFFQAQQQWQVSPDAVRKDENQAPIRMFIPDPETGKLTWSLTSSYVPNNKTNLAGFVTADSDPTSPGYGKITVERPRSENVPGPAQAYGQLINDPRITSKTQSFRLGDASPSYGNVVSVPLPGGMMYAVPVYATREGASSSSYRTLRYVMVSFGGQVGIGDTLVNAISRHGRHHAAARHQRRRQQRRPEWQREGQPQARPERAGEGTRAAGEGAARLRRRRPGLRGRQGRRVGTPQPPGPRRGRQGPQPAPVADLERRRGSRKVAASDAGWSSSVARWAHNPEVAGSNPAPATKFRLGIKRDPRPESILI